MCEKADVPEHILKIIQKEIHKEPSIQLSTMGDISHDGQFSDVWLIITDEEFITSYNDKVHVYYLNEISELKIENLPTGGMLIAAVQGEEEIVCRFSNKYAKELGEFVKSFAKIKEGKLERDDASSKDVDDKEEDKIDKRSTFKRLLGYVFEYRCVVLVVFLFMVLSSLFSLITPYMEGRILFDEVLKKGGKYYGKLGWAVLLIFLSQLLSLILNIINGRLTSKMSAKIVYDIKVQVFEALQRLPLSFFIDNRTGHLMNRVNHDANAIQYFLIDGITYFIVNLLTMIGILYVMFNMHWRLTMVIILPLIVITYSTKRIFPKISRNYSERWRRSSILNSLINDNLTGIRVVKAFGKESLEIDRFNGVNRDLADIESYTAKYSLTVFPMYGLVIGISSLAVWGLGIWEVFEDRITFGTLVTFTAYLGMLLGPIQFMVRTVDWWSNTMNSAHRIFEILDFEKEMKRPTSPIKVTSLKGNIEFKDVTFAYIVNNPILHNINMTINEGEMVGLVGHSGAGKSTITKLITRLYDVEEGNIYIDGIPIDNIDEKTLRESIAVVPQDTFLFTGTIAENIAFAKPEALPEEIIGAAKMANAHEFILDTPDGYDTVIGSQGYDLSGGQRQRISIARALLVEPKILILDEATSSLDTETELKIQEAIERLIEGRTTIAIAHRLSTLRNADKIAVIENGRIIEQGEHDELFASKGAYYNMIEMQQRALKIGGRVL